jgi:hypothetical protein
MSHVNVPTAKRRRDHGHDAGGYRRLELYAKKEVERGDDEKPATDAQNRAESSGRKSNKERNSCVDKRQKSLT